MKPHPEARELVARINQHNGELLARADAAAGQVLRAVVLVALAALGGYFLAEYFTPCETAHLCMSVVGLTTRRVRADGTPPPAMESPLPQLVQHVREARANGMAAGEKLGYVSGWRWGWICGAVLGTCFGAFLAGVLTGLVERHL